MYAKPYVVLAYYDPPRWSARAVGLHLTEITRQAGLKPLYDPIHPALEMAWSNQALHAEVRWSTGKVYSAESWHQDGDTTPGSKMDNIMVLWASETPTEFMWNGQVYQPKPYELVAVRNLSVMHRRPAQCAEDRWLFRQRCATHSPLRLP